MKLFFFYPVFLLISFYSAGQLNTDVRAVLDKGYNVNTGYEGTYRTVETESYLFVAFDHYPPGDVVSIYTRIRKSDMQALNTFKVSKYKESVVFTDDFLYVFKMVKDKEGQTEEKSKWRIEINTMDASNQIVNTTGIDVPKKFDFIYKPSFEVVTSADKSKMLLTMYSQVFWVIDNNMETLFSETYSDELVKYFFVDNEGSAYRLCEHSKLVIYDAKDNYEAREKEVAIPAGIITKNFKRDEYYFQLYSDNRIDFFMSYANKETIADVTEIYRSYFHFSVNASTKDVVDYSSSMRGIQKIADVISGLKLKDEQPLVIHIPNEFLAAKLQSGNTLTAMQGEYAHEKLLRTNKDRSRTLLVELKNAEGEKLIENKYSVVTRGVLPQHGIGVGMNADVLAIVFNINEQDLGSYRSQKGGNVSFKVNEVVTSPKKMIPVMDVLSLNDGSPLYRNVIVNSEAAKSESLAPQTFHVGATGSAAYFLSNSKATTLVKVPLPE